MARPAIKNLSSVFINAKPVDRDWSEGYAESWDFFEAETCSQCGKTVYGVHGEEQHCNLDEDSKCEGYVSCDGPMMNYAYPIDIDDVEEAAKKIVNLPLCIVRDLDTDHWFLALTGGGTDLFWEIAEAYMLLGFLPPVHFASGLPNMAGKTLSKRNRWILAGCCASLASHLQRAQRIQNWGMHNIQRIKHSMREYAKRAA